MWIRASILLTLSLSIFSAVHAQQAEKIATINDCKQGNKSNADMGNCLFNAAKKLDAEMTTLYQTALNTTHRTDSELKNAGMKHSNAEQMLQRSQAAFEKYRSSECARQEANDGGASTGSAYTGCLIELISARNAILKKIQ